MKKMKLFALAFAAMFGMSATAQEVTYHEITADELLKTTKEQLGATSWIAPIQDNGWSVKTDQEVIDPADKTKTIKLECVQLKEGNAKKTLTAYVSNCASVTVYYKNSSSSKGRSAMLTATDEGGNVSTQRDSLTLGMSAPTFTLDATKKYTLKFTGVEGEGTSGGDINVAAIFFQSGNSLDPNAPALTVSTSMLDLKMGATDETSKSATFKVSAKNIEASAIAISVPGEEFTVNPTSIPVVEKAVAETEVTVTYTPKGEQATMTANITVTAGDLVKNVEIAYNKKNLLKEATTISGSTTWDFADFAETLQIATPVKNEDFIFANIVDLNPGETFNATALTGNGEWVVRNQYFQGGALSFTTTVAGKVSVTYSNTGAKDEDRFVAINGVIDASAPGTKDQTAVTVENIAVPAGLVKIEGVFKTTEGAVNTEKGAQYLHIMKVVFTAGGQPTGIDAIEVLDMNAPMFNLMGQQVTADYKGIVIQNGAKYLLK